MIKNCQLATGIGNLKWLKCSELCAVSDEMSPPIQFRSQTAFSDSLELHLSALETADTILAKRHNTYNFLPQSLNIALWGEEDLFLSDYSKSDNPRQTLTNHAKYGITHKRISGDFIELLFAKSCSWAWVMKR